MTQTFLPLAVTIIPYLGTEQQQSLPYYTHRRTRTNLIHKVIFKIFALLPMVLVGKPVT